MNVNNVGDDEDFLEVVSEKCCGRPLVLQSDVAFGRQSRIEIPILEYIVDSKYEDDEELFSDASSEEDEWVAMKKKSRDREFNFEKKRYICGDDEEKGFAVVDVIKMGRAV